jgi:hypothetical protein
LAHSAQIDEKSTLTGHTRPLHPQRAQRVDGDEEVAA